jgi:hypothetical protein
MLLAYVPVACTGRHELAVQGLGLCGQVGRLTTRHRCTGARLRLVPESRDVIVPPTVAVLTPTAQERQEEKEREHCNHLAATRKPVRIPLEDALCLLLTHSNLLVTKSVPALAPREIRDSADLKRPSTGPAG